MKPKPLKGRTGNPYSIPGVIDPGGVRCVKVYIPDSLQWVQILAAVMDTMGHYKNYELLGDTSAAQCAALMRSINQQYNTFAGCDDCAPILESWDEDLTSLCEGLRFNNGKLQAYCCGAWVDISGQPAQGFATAAVGPGAAQPPSGGGCASYKASLPGNGLFYLPTIVNTGDTIQVTNLAGATYNPATAVAWFCGDGGQFFAGANVGAPVTAAGNPMPAVPSGTVIAKIGSTYYDVHTGLFTVPASVTNQPVTFQVNYATTTGSAGVLEFDVQVCNNVAATYTHTFNWLLGPQGFSVENLPAYTPQFNGAWASGSGWLATGAAAAGQTVHGILIKRILPAGHVLNTAELTYDLTKGTVNPGLTNGLFLQLGATSVATASRPSNTDPNGTGVKFTITPGAYTIDSIYVEIKDGYSASPGSPGSSRAYQLVVTGPGSDPW